MKRTKDEVLNELVETLKKIPKDRDICWEFDCEACMRSTPCGSNIRDLIDELYGIIKR